MIKIRLQRHGARHAPFYRMVVAPSTARRDGKFIEVLGTYDPQAHTRNEELKLKMDRVDHWLGVGAQPTDTAKSLIRQGRLTPEQWLERSEKQAAKRLARARKSDIAPSMDESVTNDGQSGKSEEHDETPPVDKKEEEKEPVEEAKPEKTDSKDDSVSEEQKAEDVKAEEKKQPAEEVKSEKTDSKDDSVSEEKKAEDVKAEEKKQPAEEVKSEKTDSKDDSASEEKKNEPNADSSPKEKQKKTAEKANSKESNSNEDSEEH